MSNLVEGPMDTFPDLNDMAPGSNKTGITVDPFGSYPRTASPNGVAEVTEDPIAVEQRPTGLQGQFGD